MSQLDHSEAEGENSFLFGVLFQSDSQWIGRGPPHWGEPSVLLSLPIQMLFSSRTTLTDIPRYHI